MDAFLERLKALSATFTTTQLATLAAAFLLVVGIVGGAAWWVSTPGYVLLFSDMDAQSASEVVARLRSMNVAYRVDPGGTAIYVRSNSVDELLLDLSAEGLPASGRPGFEIFDRTTFGDTEFGERVKLQRALEGEVARTVASLSEVSSARVHIALEEQRLFGEPRPAKASVVLKLRGNRGLSPSSVVGISNLVAASVKGLRPESVVIVDSFGRPLSQAQDDSGDPLGGAQLDRQQRLESDLRSKVVALLEPVAGIGRVRVNVALQLDPTTSEQTEEIFDPDTVLRSESTSSDTMGPAAALGSVAGTRSNLPPQPSDADTPTVPVSTGGSARLVETRNYEVSHTTRRVLQPPGDIARMSVAVVLDDDLQPRRQEDGSTVVERVPRTPEALEKIQGIVAAAVGLDPERGDSLTVQNVSFDDPIVEEEPAPSVFVRYAPEVTEVGRLLTVLVVGALAFVFFVRPLMRGAGLSVSRRVPQLEGSPSPRPRTVEELEHEIEAEIDAQTAGKATENRRLPVLTRRVSTITQKEPEQVAKLLRGWMRDAER
jgi:flagellar M-ring protein FliF